MSVLQFSKYEGSGNDFIILSASHENAITRDVAVRLCDRRYGIGADGVLLILPSRSSGVVARMRVINADGTIPEMCGNGMRCVANYVAREHHLSTGELIFDTDAGLRRCQLEREGDLATVTVDMGVVRYAGDHEFILHGEPLVFALADAGNPHAITFTPVPEAKQALWVALLSAHPHFPTGTNVEFATITGAGVDVTVWERGVGKTLACGTGACATAVVAKEKGHFADRESIPVRLPGGTLDISFDKKTQHTLMRGPARYVYGGSITI